MVVEREPRSERLCERTGRSSASLLVCEYLDSRSSLFGLELRSRESANWRLVTERTQLAVDWCQFERG